MTDADSIQTAVLACPAVAGVAVTAASYLPGRDVAGVRLADDAVDVHVIAEWDQPVADIGDQIAQAVAGLIAGRELHVFVDDILLPGQSAPPTPAELAAAARERVADIGRTAAEAGQRGVDKVRDTVRDTADQAADHAPDTPTAPPSH